MPSHSSRSSLRSASASASAALAACSRPAASATAPASHVSLADEANDACQPDTDTHASSARDPHEPGAREPSGNGASSASLTPGAPPPPNPYKGNRGLIRAWFALHNSMAGFRVAFREESAFRQELLIAAVLIPVGVWVPVEPVARVLLIGSVLLMLIVELLNSSVETAIDRISLERHELSRRAKDLGSAAVFLALLTVGMTWALILAPVFGPPLIGWLRALWH